MLPVPVAVLLIAATPTPIRLAAPGLAGVNVKPEMQAFVSEHVAQELVVAGVEVVTATQITAVLGLERQKQLLGCSDSSCLLDLGNALGVDGVLIGSIAQLGTSFQLDVKVASALDGRTLAAHSAGALDEGGLVPVMAAAARSLASQLSTAMGRPLVPTGTSQPPPVPPRLERRNTPMRDAGKWTFWISSGVTLAGVVATVIDPGHVVASGQREPGPLGLLGGVAIIAGLAGLATGAVLYFVGGTELVPVEVGLAPTRDGLLLGVSWRW